MNSNELTEKVKKEFPYLLPRISVEGLSDSSQRAVDATFDLIVEVRTPTGAKKTLLGGIRRLVEPRVAREVSRRLKTQSASIENAYPLLIAPFLSERVRQICRECDVGYLDLVGNCYLNFDAFYLERIVEKNPAPPLKSLKTLFSPVSSRILRVMLENSKKSWGVSSLAQEASVSLGQTSYVCRKLIEQEYANKDPEHRLYLSDPGRLLDDWSKSDPFFKNEVKVYYSFERSLEELMKKIASAAQQHQLRYAFTLHSGASFVAPYVRGINTAQFYIEKRGDLDKWISILSLRPVEFGGNVSLLIPYDEGVFYQLREINGIFVVGVIQLYLDLCSSPARGKEGADFLRRQQLSF